MLIVFDFDGTLMDTLRDLAEAAGDVSETYGGPRPTLADTAAMVGDGAPALVQRILAFAGVGGTHPDALPQFLACYERRVFDHTCPYDGVPAMLEALSSKGHRLALLTNKTESSTRALMRHTAIEAWLPDCVFGDGDLPRKPHPAGLRALMAQAGVGPADTLMVGDSIMDVDAARAAGARLCVARYGFGFVRIPPDRLQPDDLLIDQPMELVRLLA